MLHITDAQYLDDYRVRVTFNDGTVGVANFEDSLDGRIFLPLRDRDYFRSFYLEGHTLAWSNGADFAPEYVRQIATVEDLAEQCVAPKTRK